MTEQQPRTLAALAQANNLDLAPVEFTEDEMRSMDKAHENLTVLTVTTEEVKDYGAIYKVTIRRPNSQLGFLSQWPNIQRDGTLVALMQLCLDGPVSGVYLRNNGTDKKPFWVLTAE